MSLYTTKFAKSGVALATIPGLTFIPREAEGILDFMHGPYLDRTPVPVYDCGPYTVTVFKDGAQFGSPIDMPNHFWRSCWWLDLAPITPGSIIRSPDQLIAAGLVPPYGDTGMAVGWPVDGSITSPGPMQISSGEVGYEPTTGGRPGIGMVTAYTAKWIAGKGDARNMLAYARGVPTKPMWDYSAGKPYDLIAHPFLTNYGDTNQGGPPDWLGPYPPTPYDVPGAVLNPSYPQTAHMTDDCGVVTLATGAPRYIRALQMRVVRGFDEDNYGTHVFGGKATVFHNEMRGVAHLLRSLFFCYWATKLAEDAGNLPTDCLPSSNFKQLIDNQASQFHTYIENDIWFKTFGTVYGGQISWWQCDMLNAVLALYAGKWPVEWGPIFVKVFKNLAARVNADGKNQWPAAACTWYWGLLGDDATSGNLVPYAAAVVSDKPYLELWNIWSPGQAAGHDTSGRDDFLWLNAPQVTALNKDFRNGLTFIKPTEYESWAFAALAYGVYWDRGPGKGALSAAYPRLEAAYSDFCAMMAKIGGPIPQCSISVDAKPLDNTPLPMPPPVIQPPAAPLPAPAPDPSPAPQPQPQPPTGGTMTTIVQGKGYILTPKITAPPGAVHYGVKPGSWTIDKPDQASISPQGDAQATAKVTAIVDTTAEDITVKCDVFTDPAKTKTLTISITLSDVLVEATAGGFDVAPAQ